MTATETELDRLLFGGRTLTDSDRARVRRLNQDIVSQPSFAASASSRASGGSYVAAIHELGHAFICVCLRVPFGRIELSGTEGRVRPAFAQLHTVRHRLMVALGGPLAELDFIGRSRNTWGATGRTGTDEETIARLSAEVDNVDGVYRQTRELLHFRAAEIQIMAHQLVGTSGCEEATVMNEFRGCSGAGLYFWER